jgi:hypothetical protein
MVLALTCAALLGAAPKAGADEGHHYPVKFICDTFSDEDALASLVAVGGRYRTAINVFNASDQPGWIIRTFTRSTLVGGGPVSTSDIITLDPGKATVIECSAIAGVLFGTPFGQLPGKGFEGFVTLSSFEDLDVSAIYTAAPESAGVASLQVLTIVPKPGFLPNINVKETANATRK